MKSSFVAILVTVLCGLSLMALANAGDSGSLPAAVNDYKILAPITHGDLTIFPVVSGRIHDTSEFITLDEGIRSGQVVVTEVGNLHSSMRRRPVQVRPYGGAEVNRLVLVNNSKHPIVPAESDPVDLSVFCVEHGRWTETSAKFDTHASVMLQPSVRKQAMAEQNQQKVWDEVGRSRASMSAKVMAAAPPEPSGSGGSAGYSYSSSIRELEGTSSYAKARENQAVKQEVDSIVQPMQKSYESVIKQLRNQNAVGVVVAVKGHIVWADMFASSALLDKYWPKLLDSYATEAMTASGASVEVSIKQAQAFLDNWQARHEVVDSEPGLYRQRELIGDKFSAFQLTSLLAKAPFDVHLSKMAD